MKMSKGCQNTYENSESYLHISDVLLYVTFFWYYVFLCFFRVDCTVLLGIYWGCTR